MPSWILKDFGSSAVVAETLEKAGERSTELFGVMTRIGLDMLEIEEKLFSSGGRRGGGSWKKLKPDTIRRKGHARILIRDGMLKDSLTQAGSAFNILEPTNTSIRFGTDDPIGLVHHLGLGVVPRRPIIKFIESDERRWNRWIVEHLMRGIT